MFKPEVVGIFKPEEVCKEEVPLFLDLAFFAAAFSTSTPVLTEGATDSPIDEGGTGAGAGFTSGTLGADRHIVICFPLFL